MRKRSEEDDRLQKYRKLLARSPAYASAIAKTEAGRELTADTRLYLYVMVPALVEFVSWVLEQTTASGKRRLYFLSRDGYQMYLIARRITELRRLPVECRYLHVSRYSMRIPQFHLNPDKGLDRICTGGIDVTLERILQRAALSPEEASEVVRSIGWQDRCRDILNYRQVQELKQTLRTQTKILQYVGRHSFSEYGNTLGYLEQEGLLSDVPYAVVDSGWVGTLQESIQELIQSRRPQLTVEGYYFGMYELPKEAEPKAYHAWYFSPRHGLRRKARFSNSLFETVCSADEGMTLYYREEDGRYHPVTDLKSNPNGQQMRRNLAALQEFLTVTDGTFFGRAGKDIHLIERLFYLFMARPAGTEVQAYGDNLFSDDMLEGNLKKAAAELTEREIRNQWFFSRLLIMAGIKQSAIDESAWVEGSVVRCGRHTGRNLAHIRWYKYFVFARKQLKSIGLKNTG